MPPAVWYWIAGIVGAGTVAGFAHFSTYGSSHGAFWDAFWLYAIPIPMGIGVFHVPTLVVGTVVCVFLSRPPGRVIARVLGIALVCALAFHVAAQLTGYKDHWFYFAFVTVDIIVLFAIALFVSESRGAARHPERHW